MAGQLGLTFPLESVQDLVKKTERANWEETHTIRQKHPEENSQTLQGRLVVSIDISSNSSAKT